MSCNSSNLKLLQLSLSALVGLDSAKDRLRWMLSSISSVDKSDRGMTPSYLVGLSVHCGSVHAADVVPSLFPPEEIMEGCFGPEEVLKGWKVWQLGEASAVGATAGAALGWRARSISSRKAVREGFWSYCLQSSSPGSQDRLDRSGALSIRFRNVCCLTRSRGLDTGNVGGWFYLDKRCRRLRHEMTEDYIMPYIVMKAQLVGILTPRV